MRKKITQQYHRIRRHARVRAKIKGTAERPRLSVFRSNRFIWAQLIDDAVGKTLAQVTDWEKLTKGKKVSKKESRVMRAAKVGEKIGKIAIDQKISAVVFDRGGYRYHGRVKAVAEGARKAGVQL